MLGLVDVDVDLPVGHDLQGVLSCASLNLPPGHVSHVPLSENFPVGHVLCKHCSRAVVPVPAVHMEASPERQSRILHCVRAMPVSKGKDSR